MPNDQSDATHRIITSLTFNDNKLIVGILDPKKPRLSIQRVQFHQISDGITLVQANCQQCKRIAGRDCFSVNGCVLTLNEITFLIIPKEGRFGDIIDWADLDPIQVQEWGKLRIKEKVT